MNKKIAIKPDFKCEIVYSELDKIISRILKIHNDTIRNSAGKTEPGYVAYPFDILKELEGLRFVILNILYEKTNIRKVMDEKKYYFNINDLDKAIKGLDSKSKTPIYERFLSNLNKLSDTKKQTFFFMFPLNLAFDIKDDNKFLNKLLGKFNIKKVEIKNIKTILDRINTGKDEKLNSKPELNYLEKQIRNLHKKNELSKEDVIDYLKAYPLILSVEVEARNSGYSERFAGFLIRSFIGFLSYSENFLNEKSIPFVNIRGNKSFNQIKYDEVVVLGDSRILWPKKNMINELKEEYHKTNPIQFSSHDNLKSMCENVMFISDDLWEILMESFSLYNKASSEELIEYSFLNFWIIGERLIKGGKAKTDEEVKSIMKSMVKNDIIKKRIDYLAKKRNGLVHKGEAITEVSDRDLIKIIVDLILAEAIKMMGKFKSKKQFNYYLSNIKTKKNDRENYIEVLNILNQT